MNIPITSFYKPVVVPIRRPVVPHIARLSRIYSVRESVQILDVDYVTLIELNCKAQVWPVSSIAGQAYSGVQLVMLHLATERGFAEVYEDHALLRDSNLRNLRRFDSDVGRLRT